VQPSTVLANGVMVPPVQVQVLDANGNIVTSGSLSITLTVTPGTGTFGAMLGGASTVTAVNGIASFGNLTIDRAGTGYTLTATASGVSTASSVPFNALPFTLTFINSTFTPITLSVGGTPANGPLAAGGGAATFSWNGGRPSTVTYHGSTSGMSTQGTQIGALIAWDYTFSPAFAAADTVTMYVLPSHFFLRLQNTGFSTLAPLYVNYGTVNQTVDNIAIPPNGVLYNIGYYRAFTNTSVRAYLSPSATAYVFWNQGTHFTLLFTNNQAVTLVNTSLAPSRADGMPSVQSPLLDFVEPLRASTRESPFGHRLRGRLHAGRER
jgi:hypothetical protein